MQTGTEGGGWEGGSGFGGNVELGVVRVTVEMDVIFTENQTKWDEIYDEKNRAKDRALGNTGGEGDG